MEPDYITPIIETMGDLVTELARPETDGVTRAALLSMVLALLAAAAVPLASPARAQPSSQGYTYTIYLQVGSQNVGANGNVAPGSDVGVEGSICPSPNIGVFEGIGGNVTFVKPDGTSYTDTNIDITSSNFDYCGGGYEGSDYVDGFNASAPGTWHVYAYAWWQWSNGTEVVLQSDSISLNVGQPGPDWSTALYVGGGLVVAMAAAAVGYSVYRGRRPRMETPPPPPPPPS